MSVTDVAHAFVVARNGCEHCRVTTIDETAHGDLFKVGDPVWFVFSPTETGVITKVAPGDVEFPYYVKWDDGDDVTDEDGEERCNGWYASSHLRLIEVD